MAIQKTCKQQPAFFLSKNSVASRLHKESPTEHSPYIQVRQLLYWERIPRPILEAYRSRPRYIRRQTLTMHGRSLGGDFSRQTIAAIRPRSSAPKHLWAAGGCTAASEEKWQPTGRYWPTEPGRTDGPAQTVWPGGSSGGGSNQTAQFDTRQPNSLGRRDVKTVWARVKAMERGMVSVNRLRSLVGHLAAYSASDVAKWQKEWG